MPLFLFSPNREAWHTPVPTLWKRRILIGRVRNPKAYPPIGIIFVQLFTPII